MKKSILTLFLLFSLSVGLGIVSARIPTNSPCPSPQPSGPERPDHRCGPNYGDSPCNPGRCCSVYEYCGSGPAYCQGGQCKYQCWTSPPPMSLPPTSPTPPPPPSPPPPSPPPPPPGPERPDHKCGPNYGDSPCNPGRCCSIYEYCGSGPAYCQGGQCKYQCWTSPPPMSLPPTSPTPPPPPSPPPPSPPPPSPGPERPDHKCGPHYGDSPCNPGRCCSIFEYCGSGPAYCEDGQCIYQCWTSPPPSSPIAPPPPPGPERPDHRCGPAFGNIPCDAGRCCSINGYCGSTSDFCEPGSCRSQCWTGPPPS